MATQLNLYYEIIYKIKHATMSAARYKLFVIYCMTDMRNNYVCVRKFCEEFSNFFTETFVDFSSSNFTVSKLAGSLIVTLVSSGKVPSQSFIIGIIAEADNTSVFPATGKKFIFVNVKL